MCMGGQMPYRRPNQVSGRSVSHPIEEAVQHGVTRGKGRIENNKLIAIRVFFLILCKPDKVRQRVSEVMLDFSV